MIVRLLKMHFLHRSSIVKSQQNIIELVTRPGVSQTTVAVAGALPETAAAQQMAHLPPTIPGWIAENTETPSSVFLTNFRQLQENTCQNT